MIESAIDITTGSNKHEKDVVRYTMRGRLFKNQHDVSDNKKTQVQMCEAIISGDDKNLILQVHNNGKPLIIGAFRRTDIENVLQKTRKKAVAFALR